MSDQTVKNITFEVLETNKSLQKIADLLYDLYDSNSPTVEILSKELTAIQKRIARLNYLLK